MTDAVRLLAPAKLTVSLRVRGRRTDGYHCLVAEMVSIDLCDSLVVDVAGDGLEVATAEDARGAVVPAGPENLVARALKAVERTAHVALEKRIPVGGGLGGGSADAAAILRWAGCTDLAVAARLGADVPFCLAGGRAMVGGIGERLTPLPFLPRSFVLLVPPLAVDTAAVYRAWDGLSGGDSTGKGRPGNGAKGQPPRGHNDLTAAALQVEPQLAAWRDAFKEATGRTPVLAGSGSTWWVEGAPDRLGLAGCTALDVGGEEGRLIPARAVPAAWNGTER